MFDIVISLILLITLSPLLVPISIILKLTGEGDIWYFQRRIGLNNEIFEIYKFATMLRDSPSMLTGSLTLRNDPRVTTVGKYLRATKINELPQLINVLKGDMALIGPRPQVEEDFLAYPKYVQESIYNIKPGITGMGSIFFRDEEKMMSAAESSPRDFYNDVVAPYKGELELWYQENVDLWLDLKILLLTVFVVVCPSIKMRSFFPGMPKIPTALTPFI